MLQFYQDGLPLIALGNAWPALLPHFLINFVFSTHKAHLTQDIAAQFFVEKFKSAINYKLALQFQNCIAEITLESFQYVFLTFFYDAYRLRFRRCGSLTNHLLLMRVPSLCIIREYLCDGLSPLHHLWFLIYLRFERGSFNFAKQAVDSLFRICSFEFSSIN